MISNRYTNLTVLSIAAVDNRDLSFSADTGMAECLVIARKLIPKEMAANTSDFLSLITRPVSFSQSAAIGSAFFNGGQIRGIEDGPFGGTPLTLGDEKIGEMLTIQCDYEGEPWSAVRLADCALAQVAFGLSRGNLYLPGVPMNFDVDMAQLGEIGERGYYDMNIVGRSSSAPFAKTQPSATATYPALWNHDAKKETKFVCVPDSQLVVKNGLEDKAGLVWATRSRSHISRGFRFNSQPCRYCVHRTGDHRRAGIAERKIREKGTGFPVYHLVKLYARIAFILVARQSSSRRERRNYHQLDWHPPGPRLPNPHR